MSAFKSDIELKSDVISKRRPIFKKNGENKGKKGSLRSGPVVRSLWRAAGSGAKAPPLAARSGILWVFGTVYHIFKRGDFGCAPLSTSVCTYAYTFAYVRRVFQFIWCVCHIFTHKISASRCCQVHSESRCWTAQIRAQICICVIKGGGFPPKINLWDIFWESWKVSPYITRFISWLSFCTWNEWACTLWKQNACMYIYVWIYTNIYVNISIYTSCAFVCVYIHVNTYLHIHVYIYIYIDRYMYVYTHIHICKHKYVCIHVYMHMHKHIRTKMHTDTRTLSLSLILVLTRTHTHTPTKKILSLSRSVSLSLYL